MNVNSDLGKYKSFLDKLTVNDQASEDRIYKDRDGNAYSKNYLHEQFDKIKKETDDPKLITSIQGRIKELDDAAKKKLGSGTSLTQSNEIGTNVLSQNQNLPSLEISKIEPEITDIPFLNDLPADLLGLVLSKKTDLRNIFFTSLGPKTIRDANAANLRLKLSQGIKSALTTQKMIVGKDSGFENALELQAFLKVYGHDVRKLDLSGYGSYIDDVSIVKFISLTPNLESLNVSQSSITDSFMQNMNSESLNIYFKNLNELNLSRCHHITDAGLKNLSIPSLTALNLMDVDINGSCFAVLNLKGLKKLDIGCCEKLTDENLKKLGNSVLTLEELKLSSTNLSGICFEELKLNNLKRLYLSGCKQLTDENLKKLKSSNLKLEELDLSSTNLDGTCFEKLELKDLKRLYLKDCKLLTEENLKNLKSSNLKLEVLDLSRTNLDGSCFEKLKLKDLKILYLENCKLLTEENLKNLISSNLKLEVLDLSSTNLDGSCFEELELVALKSLNISHCVMLTQENIEKLNAPNLEELNLGYTDLDVSFLKQLQLRNLKKLNLSKCEHLTDKKLIDIRDYIIKLEELDVSRTKVNGFFLDGLKLKNLKSLDISDCEQLREENLKYLKGYKLEKVCTFEEKFLRSIFEYIDLNCLEELVMYDTSITGLNLTNLIKKERDEMHEEN